MRNKILLFLLVLTFAALMSLPWLIPGCGWVALIAFIPLLIADAVADELKLRRFWMYHFTAFVLWNTETTFWVCNATVGGGVFAILYNSIQMSLIWGVFRFSKKRFDGVLPYVFLASLWIAWERLYHSVDISWPWLTLGNAFAQNTTLVQWYEYTGVLGGSLWIWVCNLGLFGLFSSLVNAAWRHRTVPAFIFAHLGVILSIAGPILLSKNMYRNYCEKGEGKLDILIVQPNFDPYQKFHSMTQSEQTAVLLDECSASISKTDTSGLLVLAPETFTDDVILGSATLSATEESIRSFLSSHKAVSMLYGASTYEIFNTRTAPSILARPLGDGWYESHNSAIMESADGSREIFHKSKLVVGTELTPYPKFFVPFEKILCRILGETSLMGRCVGQKEISLLHAGAVPLGCAICYESVYGEYCTGYVRKGAKAMTVITNDAWWGDTPGYRQHLSYSRLRAIELRRDFARCGNTGISALIDQKGDILSSSPWWKRCTIRGEINLNSSLTFFSLHGDIIGRVSSLLTVLLAALLIVRFLIRR